MRKLLLLTLLLAIQWTARGQSERSGRYWFDNDDGQAVTLPSVGERWQEQVDVSHLGNWLHAFHFQLKDAEGVWSAPQTRLFIKLPNTAENAARYWFDNDNGQAVTLPSLGERCQEQVDVSHLGDWLHAFHFQLKDANGACSAPRTQHFIKFPVLVKGETRYWFDNDEQTIRTYPAGTGAALIDASQLRDGIHLLHVQAKGASPRSQMFLKVPQVQGIDSMTCMLFVDGQTYRKESVSTHEGLLHWEIDAAAMTPGIHKVQMLVVTPSGVATGMRETFFYRAMTPAEQASMKCYYSIDGSEHLVEAGSYRNGTFHFDLDQRDIADGLHQISLMLITEQGVASQSMSAFFMKTPLGGNGITRYDYWLNDHESEAVRQVLPEHIDPLKLVQLIPVQAEPFRSSSFAFEVDKEGKPMLYARNDFHLRTFDAANRLTESSAPFIDRRVKRELTDVVPLTDKQGILRDTRPAANAIRWHELTMGIGDTLALRLSQPATVQVFSPTGQEVYAASGAESTAFGGCHAREAGTYWIALHDATGTQSGNALDLDFLHLDRYDVFAQDVHTVGNGGYNTITFQGNGFSELESVALDGTLLADSITRHCDYETAVRFDCSRASIGKHTLEFRFKDGTKVLDDCLTVEEARPISISTKVSYASTYLRGTTNYYTIELTNTSNMTAYDVPMPVSIYVPTMADLLRVEVKGYDLYGHFHHLFPDVFTQHFADSVAALKDTEGDLAFFTHEAGNDEVAGFPAKRATGMGVDIAPNSTRTIQVGIQANGTAHLYTAAPTECDVLEGNPAMRKARKKNDGNKLCAIYDNDARACQAQDWYYEQTGEILPNECKRLKRPDFCPPPPGGSSNSVNSLDPNDIYGYTAESGSRFMTGEVKQTSYRIEFENDPEFATASAHVVVVKDTLSAALFDLNSYAPTGFRIGSHTETLDGSPRFVRTVDLRPSIDALVQVEGAYDSHKGIATWRFTSLDPMTMEPSDNVMQGFLPVNYDGTSGIGEVNFDVKFRSSMPHGTKVTNRAAITFDSNEPILTPTWTNTVDAVAPQGGVKEVTAKNDTLVTVHFDGRDDDSGIWRYELHVQYGKGSAWEKVATCDTTCTDFRIYRGMEYAFCALAVDSAGNVQTKELAAEAKLNTCLMGDADSDGVVNALDAALATSRFLGQEVYLNFAATDVNEDGVINALDVALIQNIYLAQSGKKAQRARKRIKTKRSK